MNYFLNATQSQEVATFTLPRFSDLPTMDLYMDQVISSIESYVSPLIPQNEKTFLTATMIANYVKQGIVTPPRKKRYNKNHLAYLIVVCLLKHVFSMSQICEMIQVHIDRYPIDVAYDYFCTELEKALRDSAHGESLALQVTEESEMVRKAVICYANYVYIEQYLLFRNHPSE